jgi:hypothetical protein
MMSHKSSSKWALGLTGALLLGTAMLLVACGTSATPTPCPEVACPECPEAVCPECPEVVCPECPEVVCPDPVIAEFPHYEALWASSGHNAAETGTTVTCIACHNEATAGMSSVTFPSGLEVTGLSSETRCMQCHQGRASATSVDDAIAEAGLTDDDTVSEELGFVNIQDYAAAATRMGTWAMGGYQYAGKRYDARFAHVEGFDACTDCHDAHSLELKLEGCGECHRGVDKENDLEHIRGLVSDKDYDGDGKTGGGILCEIEGLQQALYRAIQAYAEGSGTLIVHDPHTAPYFFVDSNGNGEVDEGEAANSNAYNAWTGRLLKAAYNYQFSTNDPGAFIHGGKYVIQLLYDSIEDLDAELVEDLTRDDVGHFAGSEEAWRHWDREGQVPSSCAKCHSAAGLPVYLLGGSNAAEPPAHGILCTTCHSDLKKFKRYVVNAVEFPSGVALSIGPDSNLCISCHQGRESSVSVDAMIEGLAPDSVSEDLQLPDVHYYTAGATLFGSEARGAYQYKGRQYWGRNVHVLDFDDCIDCHGGHRLTIREDQCATCHGRRIGEETTKPQHHASGMECYECHGTVDVEKIRGHKELIVPVDHDGDGDVKEGLVGEVVTIHEALYAAIQAYAQDVIGAPIVYDADTCPHFFTDTNGNGKADPDEVNYDNRYSTWTPRLIQAAFNYLYSAKEPGAFAHNGKYIIQVLYDSLADIGGNTTGMIRP